MWHELPSYNRVNRQWQNLPALLKVWWIAFHRFLLVAINMTLPGEEQYSILYVLARSTNYRGCCLQLLYLNSQQWHSIYHFNCTTVSVWIRLSEAQHTQLSLKSAPSTVPIPIPIPFCSTDDTALTPLPLRTWKRNIFFFKHGKCAH